MTSFLKVSARNLKRNPRRSLALLFTIMTGFAGFIFVAGHIARWEKYQRYNSIYLNHIGSVSVFRKDGLEKHFSDPAKFSISESEQKKIAKTLEPKSEVDFIGSYLQGTGLASNGCLTLPVFINGIDVSVEERVRNNPFVRAWSPELSVYQKGRGFWEFESTTTIGLAEDLAKKLGKPNLFDETKISQAPKNVSVQNCKSLETVELVENDTTVQLLASTFSGFMGISEGQVVNHYSTGSSFTNDSQMSMSLQGLQSLLDTDTVSYVAVFLKDHEQANDFAKSLSAEFLSQGLSLEVFPFTDARVNPDYTGDLSFLTVLGTFALVVISLVIVLSVLNFLTITILERTREIGTLRAIGYSPSTIASILLYESLMVNFAGIFLGGVLAFVSKNVLNAANIRFRAPGVAGTIRLMIAPSLMHCVVLALFVTLLVSVTSFLFSRRRAKANIQYLLSSTFE